MKRSKDEKWQSWKLRKHNQKQMILKLKFALKSPETIRSYFTDKNSKAAFVIFFKKILSNLFLLVTKN